MAKIAFIKKSFRGDSLELISRANLVLDSYAKKGLRLTLRQLYYQLVSHAGLRNIQSNYKRLSSVISDARLAGLVDWDAIEDRIRQPHRHPEFDGIPDLMEAAIRSYRLPRWEGQKHYIEVHVEKDALAGVLRPITDEFHVVLMVNRGYSSQTSMYEGAVRIGSRGKSKKKVVLYIGDHDASGLDMVRDIADRLEVFGMGRAEVRKIALTMEQVKAYDLPPNPANMRDSRAEKYVEEHGEVSWEVDALPPEVLQALVRSSIEKLLDRKMMDKVIRQEEADKAEIREWADERREP